MPTKKKSQQLDSSKPQTLETTTVPTEYGTTEARCRIIAEKTSVSIGPLPPPSILKEYEDSIPGSAERILTAADEERKHRHKSENSLIGLGHTYKSRGQWLAFGALLVVIGATATLAFFDKQVVASVLGGIGVPSIVGMFIWGDKFRGSSNNEES